MSRPHTTLTHYPLFGNHFLDVRLEVVQMNGFDISNWFRRGGKWPPSVPHSGIAALALQCWVNA